MLLRKAQGQGLQEEDPLGLLFSLALAQTSVAMPTMRTLNQTPGDLSCNPSSVTVSLYDFERVL